MNTQDPFDASLRACHARSLERLSPVVRAQLAQRRHAAMRGGARGAPRLRYAIAGFAAVSALVLGLQLRQPALPSLAPASPAVAGSEVAPRGDTLLDEDPEFYAWLASSDAGLMAME